MFRKSIAPLAGALALVGATAAFAASQTMTDTIKSVDATRHELAMKDGKTFELPANFDLATVKAGEKVKITYDTEAGKMVASKVEKVN
ncbi:MAG: DUF1344 domain-containing protein [Hyphomicrobiaceae bacterium]